MRRLIPGFVALALAGCSVSPAPLLTIPKGHPGSDESAEAPYTPPPNPFKQEVPETAAPGPKDAKHDHAHHDHGKAPEAKKPYPLEVCVVTGEKLGSMGTPAVIQHEGREVRFCCPACIEKFKQDPAKYLKKLDEAEKKKHEGHR